MSHYVPDGAFLICTEGANFSELKVTSQSSVRFKNNKLAGTHFDKMDKDMNCIKLAVMMASLAAAIAAAILITTVFTGGAAIPLWAGAVATAGSAGGAGIIGYNMSCNCANLTSPSWELFHKTVKFEKNVALMEVSKLPCSLGGVVKILYSLEAAKAFGSLKKREAFYEVGKVVITSAIFSLLGGGKGIATGIKALYKRGAAFAVGKGFALFGIDQGISLVFDSAQSILGISDKGVGEILTNRLSDFPFLNLIVSEENMPKKGFDTLIKLDDFADNFFKDGPKTGISLGDMKNPIIKNTSNLLMNVLKDPILAGKVFELEVAMFNESIAKKSIPQATTI